MSSLRISQHNRAIGAATGTGDASARPEKSDDAGFAAALGAAGIAPKDAAAALLGGTAGDAYGGGSHARKKADAPAANGAASSTLAAQMLLAGAAVDPPVAPITVSSAGAGQSGSGGAASAVAPIAADTTTPITTGATSTASAASSGATSLLSAGAAAIEPLVAVTPAVSVAAAVLPAAAAFVAGSTPAASDTIDPAVASANPSAGAPSAPHPALAAIANTTTVAPNTTGGGATGAVPAGIVPADPSQAAAPVSPAAAAATRSAASAVATHAAGAGRLPDANFAAALDPTGSPTAPVAVPLAAASLGEPPALSGLPAGLDQALPPVGGAQPNAGDNAGASFGDTPRDRFTAIAAPADGGAGVATALGDPSAGAPLAGAGLTAPGADATPGIAAGLSDQISGQLVRMASSGTRDMVMRLHPPELGDLTVRVAVAGRDVSAWFASPQPQVQSAITAALGQLQTDLGNAGYNLSGTWVGADASGAQQQAANLVAPPPRAPLAISAAAVAVPVAARAPASGLNIYV